MFSWQRGRVYSQSPHIARGSFFPRNNYNLLLEPRRYGKEQIESNAQRLKQENLLIETENHWLTNTQNAEVKEICEQAMSVVMPEILEIMELAWWIKN